jgi:beta-phosphoglucomutase
MTERYWKHAVLWDMDGVLVDTGDFHFAAWKQTFEDLGIPFEREDFKTTFGMNNDGILEWAYKKKPTQEEVARISDRKETLFRKLVKGKTGL